MKKYKKGFTLIEILLVLGIIAILAGIVLVAVNPSRQFKQARDSQRVSNVNAILNAIGQNIADHRGVFTCAGSETVLPENPGQVMKSSGGFDIRPCLVPVYLAELPHDPSVESASGSYDTGYTVSRDGDTDRITISSVSEIDPSVPIEVTR
ncbi:MAG: type II secretion system protein [Candidatus Paceibacterota bacterium]